MDFVIDTASPLTLVMGTYETPLRVGRGPGRGRCIAPSDSEVDRSKADFPFLIRERFLERRFWIVSVRSTTRPESAKAGSDYFPGEF
jgi:hypothetical protein